MFGTANDDARGAGVDPGLPRQVGDEADDAEAVGGGADPADARGLRRPAESDVDPGAGQPARPAEQAHLRRPAAALPTQVDRPAARSRPPAVAGARRQPPHRPHRAQQRVLQPRLPGSATLPVFSPVNRTFW